MGLRVSDLCTSPQACQGWGLADLGGWQRPFDVYAPPVRGMALHARKWVWSCAWAVGIYRRVSRDGFLSQGLKWCAAVQEALTAHIKEI